jgi:hypothetical protein
MHVSFDILSKKMRLFLKKREVDLKVLKAEFFIIVTLGILVYLYYQTL